MHAPAASAATGKRLGYDPSQVERNLMDRNPGIDVNRNPYAPPEAPVSDAPNSPSSRRPGGITLLCVLLGWFAFAGFGNAAVLLSGKGALLPRWVGVVAVAYGLAAYAAAVGLWRMHRWARQALRAWMATCLLLLVSFWVLFPSRLILGGVWGALGFTAGIAVAFWGLDEYVGRRLGS
jgi:hypothetical protein